MLPEHIGRYEIKSELGRGGMSTVYRAYDPRFKRFVALKVLPAQFLHDPTFRARFEREAEIIASLEHPAIVPVYDFGEENDQPYLVMRLMPGGSLADRLERGPLPLAEAARILGRLAPAMDRAHAGGIIHRDLKPGNILFDADGDVYLSDFGIAKLVESAATMTGTTVVGTPAYMSPEQARGDKDVDARTDLYALGAIVYQMITGQLPYDADTPMGLAVKHITEPVPSVRAVRPDLPSQIDTLVSRAMAKQREARYSSAVDLAADFQAAAGQAPPTRPAAAPVAPAAVVKPAAARPTVVVRRDRPPARPFAAGPWAARALFAVVAVFALLGLTGLGVWRLLAGRGPARPTQPAAAATATSAAAPTPTLPAGAAVAMPTASASAVAATPTPSGAVNPSAHGQLLYEDVFDQDTGAWQLGQWSRIQGGTLTLATGEEALPTQAAEYADFVLELGFRFVEPGLASYFGIFVREGQCGSASLCGYQFWFSSARAYGARAYLGFGATTTLLPNAVADQLALDATNRLTVVARGGDFAEYLNSQLIGAFADDNFSQGGLHLNADNGSVAVDYIRLYALP